ncbi:MAG: hypothetical protein AAF550_08225 [Myxococcota bacterium]
MNTRIAENLGRFLIAFSLTSLTVGCDDDSNGTSLEDPNVQSGLCPSGESGLSSLSEIPSFAVISTDFSSTAVSLLGAEAEVLAESWHNSGVTRPGLVAALSGDVVFPSAQYAGTFGVIDRFGTDAVSLFCQPEGDLVGQVRLSGNPDGKVGFRSNPHDYVIVSDTSAFASRYSGSLDPDAPEIDQGTDLLGFDPTTMTLNGDRVDLSDFNEVVTGLEQSEGGERTEVDVSVVSRPSRIVRIGDYLIVGLDRLSSDFSGPRGHGDGITAVVDLNSETVTGVPLGGLANCGQVTRVPGTEREVLVACKGYSNVSFFDEEGVRATSGLVQLRLNGSGELEEVARFENADDTSSLLATWTVTSLGDGLAVGVALGNGDDVTDRLVLTELETGSQEVLIVADGSFVLGQSAYGTSSGLLLVPNSGADEIHRFVVSTDGETTLQELDAVTVARSTGLPPVRIAAL